MISAWSRRIALTDVPDEGLHVAMEADSDVRATLARTAGLRDLPRLSGEFRSDDGRVWVFMSQVR